MKAGWDPGALLASRASRLVVLARFVRVEHTLFSLPFAYAGALLAGLPEPLDILLIGLAVLGLRTAGMSMNNIADRDIDALNPRTRSRPLVTGAVSLREAWALVVLGSLVFYVSAALLNAYALLLSPLVWIVPITYPYAKRLHWLPHLHLGLSLGLTVLGGYVAVAGDHAESLAELLAGAPWTLILAVALWVSGFDTIYSVMDVEFDRRYGLGSLPARLGVEGALWAAAAQHALAILLLAATIELYSLGPSTPAGVAAAAALMAYQHILVRRSLENIPRAFNTNLLIAPLVTLTIIADRVAAALPPV